LRVWRGKEERVLEKGNEQMKEIEDIGKVGFCGIIQNLSYLEN